MGNMQCVPGMDDIQKEKTWLAEMMKAAQMKFKYNPYVTNEIIWCDSDPNIKRSATLIKKKKYTLTTFNDTAKCLEYFKYHPNKDAIDAVITSGMRFDAKENEDSFDGLDLLDKIKRCCYNEDTSEFRYPVFAIVSKLSIPADECAERGIAIVASYDIIDTDDIRLYVQQRVLSVLGTFDMERKKLKSSPFTSIPTESCNANEKQCREFLTSLIKNQGWYQYFDYYADHCFCSKCEKVAVFYRGFPKEKYVLPIGWYRFGIQIRKDCEMKEVEKWCVAYHGTPTDRVESIMQHRRIMFPGDKLNNGTILPIRLNACYADKVSKDGKVIYCSPTIKYAGHPNYARPKRMGQGMVAQVVFQVKVKPGCFKKFPETLREKDYDPEISDKEIEWVTADRRGIAPYAALVRIMPEEAFDKRYIDD